VYDGDRGSTGWCTAGDLMDLVRRFYECVVENNLHGRAAGGVFVTMNIKLMYPIGEHNNRDLGFKISIDAFLEYVL